MDSKSFRKKLFGGEIEIIIYNPSRDIDEKIEEMYKEALRLEKIFSF